MRLRALVQGIWLGLGIAVGGGGAEVFSPASFFAASEPGYVYDNNDFDRYMATGPELIPNTTWDGASGTTPPTGASNVGWYASSDGTYSVSGGRITITNGTLGRTGFYFAIPTVVGRQYVFSAFGIDDGTSGVGQTQVRGTSTINPNLSELGLISRNSNTSGRVVFTATATTSYISITNYSVAVGAFASVGSVSVKELLAYTPTMFQDSLGTIPVSGANQPVGLQLDKRLGLVAGTEYVQSGFTDPTATWDSFTPSAGGFTATKSTAGGGDLAYSIANVPVTLGNFYRVEIDVSANTISSTGVYISSGANSRSTAGYFSGTGTKVIYLHASVASGTFSIALSTSLLGSITVDAVRVAEIPGLHRYQPTTSNKPVLRGTPTGANLLNGTDGTLDAGWVNSGGGIYTATATTGFARLNAPSMTTGRIYRLRYTATVSSGTFLLQAGGGGSGTVRSASGTYEDYVTAAGGAAFLYLDGATSFTGTVSAIEVKDVSADAVQAPYGLQYDGVDDFMLTASADFTATDKVTVCAGIRKLRDAAVTCFVEFSSAITSNNGAFAFFTPVTAANASYTFVSKGTAQVIATSPTTFAAPITGVITGLGDISVPATILRVNGAQEVTTPITQGTGNYGNYPFYFGRRAGTSLAYNGLDYGGFCIGRLLTTPELTNGESWTAERTGVTL